MKKVFIKPGCIACGTCQSISPTVFTVTDQSRIVQNAPITQEWDKIKEAERSCPVGVIQCLDSE